MVAAKVSEPMSLHRKLTEVMAAIDWQPKTGRNQQQNYSFVSVERIKDAVRTELAKQRVMVYTSTKTIERSEVTTRNGGTMSHVTIQGEVTFADGDSGEMFTVEAAGEAMDSGDKALNKAQTAMVKYALINTFLIPTGDDPDQETPDVTERKPARREYGRGSFPADEPLAAPLDAGRPIPESAPPPKPTLVPMVQCESHLWVDGNKGPQCRLQQGHQSKHTDGRDTWAA